MPAAEHEPQWLLWARELQAHAQSGLHFTRDPHDRLRYEMIRAISARMMALQSGYDVERVVDLFAEQSGYATPKVDVRGAVFRDGKILLVREIADSGRWSLPGGWADVNQSPAVCVVREVREETGFEVITTKLAAVYDRAKHPHAPPFPFHVYKLFFICQIVGGGAAGSIETEAPTFFGPREIPPLSESRVLPSQIERMFAHARDPQLACEYD